MKHAPGCVCFQRQLDHESSDLRNSLTPGKQNSGRGWGSCQTWATRAVPVHEGLSYPSCHGFTLPPIHQGLRHSALFLGYHNFTLHAPATIMFCLTKGPESNSRGLWTEISASKYSPNAYRKYTWLFPLKSTSPQSYESLWHILK